MDISANDIEFDEDLFLDETYDDVDEIEDVSGDDYFPEHIPDDLHGHELYVMESETLNTDTSNYSAYLEDINTTLKFQTAVIIGFLLLVGFIIGWKK